jgi:hypothetical protein
MQVGFYTNLHDVAKRPKQQALKDMNMSHMHALGLWNLTLQRSLIRFLPLTSSASLITLYTGGRYEQVWSHWQIAFLDKIQSTPVDIGYGLTATAKNRSVYRQWKSLLPLVNHTLNPSSPAHHQAYST